MLVAAENFRAFGCDLWHVAVPRRGGPRDAIDELWEVEWLLHLPDFLMLIRREKPGGIAYGNPPDRNGCVGGQCRPQVNDGIHPHLGIIEEPCAVKNTCASGDKHALFQGAPHPKAMSP